jgi:tetratricopeptide (TPR) repeat protein
MSRSSSALCLGLALAVPPAAAEPRRFEPSTESKPARELLARLQRSIENLALGKANAELARKLVEADPDWAMAVYYQSAVTPPPASHKLLERAAELARQAKDGERRFVEAMVVARGRHSDQAVPLLQKLAADYPGERVVPSLLGQLLAGLGRSAEARAAFEQAIALDATTPRAHTFVGSLSILEGDYAKARRAYTAALERMPAGQAPGQIRYSVAFSWLYEGRPDKAIDSLESFLIEYRRAGEPFGIPEVFIWNAIARIQLESGRPSEALKAYERGYASVRDVRLDDDERKLWLGRLQHGKGRALARLGKFEAAWKQARVVKQMIAEAGERGREYEPAWHYLAGYIALEQGDAAKAIEHLEQSRPAADPFRGLLLGRAYELSGDRKKARKAYEGVVAYGVNNIERALSYPEAKRRLQAL